MWTEECLFLRCDRLGMVHFSSYRGIRTRYRPLDKALLSGVAKPSPQSHSSAGLAESQFLPVSPHGTRIESPGTTIPSCEHVVDDPWHEERYRRKVVHTTLEIAVCSTKHQGPDAVLEDMSTITEAKWPIREICSHCQYP